MHLSNPYSPSRLIHSFLLLALTTSLGAIATPAALAQSYIPPDRGLPGRREGGGTRGNCITAQPTLTALMPQSNFGRTTRAYPTLLWYIPKNTAVSAEFELMNDQEETVYKTQVQLTSEPGIIQLTAPETVSAAALEVGRTYHWYFSLVCDPQDRSGDPITEGWIERIQPDALLLSQLDKATDRDRATRYAEAGIWYDALNTLVELQAAYPQDSTVLRSWKALLTSVDLGKLAELPQ
jgi:hypothetical protein